MIRHRGRRGPPCLPPPPRRGGAHPYPHVAPHAPQPHTRCPRACAATRRRRARGAALGSMGRQKQSVPAARCPRRPCARHGVGNSCSVRATMLTASTPHAALSPWRWSGGCRARAGARAQRPVRATARRPLAVTWSPPPQQRGREARAAALSHLPQGRTRGGQAGSPRATTRTRIRRARAQLPPPRAPWARRCAASHSTRTPPSARARPRGASSSGVRQDPAMVVASQRHSACRLGGSSAAHDSRVDAPTRATSSKRWRFRDGWYRGGACRGCRAESAPAARNEKDSCPPRPLGRALAASRQRAREGRHHSTSHSRCRTTPKSSRGSVAARRPSPRAAAAPRVCVRAPLLALCAGAASPAAGPPIRASAPRRSASTCTSAASSRRRVEPPPIYPTRLTLAQLCKPARPRHPRHRHRFRAARCRSRAPARVCACALPTFQCRRRRTAYCSREHQALDWMSSSPPRARSSCVRGLEHRTAPHREDRSATRAPCRHSSRSP